MALPKTTQDRIEQEAKRRGENHTFTPMDGDYSSYKFHGFIVERSYITGATAEATEAFEMYKMLVLLSQYHYQAKDGRELNHDAIIGKIEEHLQQWNAGGEIDRPCPRCGKELNRDRNLCCRECGEEVEG